VLYIVSFFRPIFTLSVFYHIPQHVDLFFQCHQLVIGNTSSQLELDGDTPHIMSR
jgi:hypothetical protein